MIGIHDPLISDDEEHEVLEALRSNWLSGGGAKVEAFEEEMRRFLGLAFPPLAVVNGSSALVLALKTLGVKHGEHVLVSSYGFVATANSIRQVGAEPIFIGPETETNPVVSLSQLKEFLFEYVDREGRYKPTGRKVRGMLYNQPYGLVCPQLSECVSLLAERGMFLVEDASQSIGVRGASQFLGTIGTLGVFSFNGNKTITTGSGGLLIGRDQALLERARKLRNQARSDSFEFIYDEEGNNFLMSNVLGAIGLSQARRLPVILNEKIKLRSIYKNLFKDSGIILAGAEIESFPAWLNVALLPRSCGDRGSFSKLATSLMSRGFQLRPAFPPVTSYPMYAECHRHSDEFASSFYQRAVCLPSGAGVTEEQAGVIVSMLLENAKKLSMC